ncbi:MAG: peptidase A24 [Actinomycetales bacterium]|nr:MAG: peptidase A24 [Actinomycetales bacterium]
MTGSTGPLWLVIGCAVAGLPIGWYMRRELATGGYRIVEDESGPLPRGQWLVLAGVPVLWGVLAWRVGTAADGTLLPALLLYATVGVALSWIDADVHRLPHGLTMPLAAGVVGLLLVSAALTRDFGSLGRAVTCAGISFVVYLVLVLLSSGSFGIGDLVLGTITGLLLGFLGWPQPLLAIAAGFVISSVVLVVRLVLRQITLKTTVAFGPYILLGALWVVLAHAPSP